MRTQRKLFAWIMSAILILSIIPSAALADEGEEWEPTEQAVGTIADEPDYSSAAAVSSAKSTYGQTENANFWYIGADKTQDAVYAYLTENEDDGSDTATYTLTVSGSGAMQDYGNEVNTPWYGKGAIQTLVIQNGVTSVGSAMARWQTLLEKVVLADSVTQIGGQAFQNCKSLKEMNFPNALTSIGIFAFGGSALETADLSACTNLVSFERAFQQSNVTTVTLPDNLKSIPAHCFDGSKLTSIKFPEGLQSIGESAFQSVPLTNINIPDSVTSIGKAAFAYTKLQFVVIPNGVKNIEDQTFMNTSEMYAIVLPGTLSTISSVNPLSASNLTFYIVNTENYDECSAKNAVSSYSTWRPIAVTNGGFFAADTAFEPNKLAPPTKVGYVPGGWYSDSNFSGEVATSVTAGQTYYAKWTLKAPTVNVTADKTSVVNGENVTLTATAEHELKGVDYEYQWYTGTLDSGSEISGATGQTYTDNNLTADTTYYCKVTAKDGDGNVSEAATSNSVAITVSANAGTLSLPVSSNTVSATVGTITFQYTYNGDGKVSVSSSDESVAAAVVDETAKTVTVTVKKAGKATITVSAAATEQYTAVSSEYTLTVNAPTPSGSSSSGSSSSSGYTVTVDSGKNGTVTVSPKTAKKGDTVTITVKPDTGYELDELTVTDKNGKTVKVTEGKNGKFTFTMPATKVTVEATFVKIEEAQTFIDVPDGYWAEDAIAWAYENSYMNGNSAVTFNPEGTVTRQQLWMILARLSGYQPADFTEAKAWAVDNGISDGTIPGNAVSRQQLVTILYRYAVRMGYNTTAKADLSQFPDHASVASYATDAMAWSVANNIVGGTTQGTLNPAGTATRAQFAVILNRFHDKMLG